jgi:sarcosine oxidase
MTTHTYDAIVIGLGGMGAAALCALARRGRRVLGIERFDLGHGLGSSGLGPRIYRFAQFLDPAYVPLMRHAFEHWARLERDAGQHLLFRTGGIDMGVPGSALVEGSKAACRLHGLPHEVLTAADIRRRFPAWQVPDGIEAVYQPDSGIIGAEAAIHAHLAVADRHGADIRARTRVIGIRERAGGVEVETSRGRLEAGCAIVTAGPWAGEFAPGLAAFAVPERQVVGWFQPRPQAQFARGAFPVFIVEDKTGSYYGFPVHDRPGVKLARHGHRNEATTGDTIRRTIDADDEAVLTGFTRRWFGDRLGAPLALATCLYTNTPDNHFIIDRLPGRIRTWIAAGFSGHGYKFCAGIGEILADLALDGATAAPVHLFAAARFVPSIPAQ